MANENSDFWYVVVFYAAANFLLWHLPTTANARGDSWRDVYYYVDCWFGLNTQIGK